GRVRGPPLARAPRAINKSKNSGGRRSRPAKKAGDRFADMAALFEGPNALPAPDAALAASSLAPARPGTRPEPVVGKGRRGLWIVLAGVAAIAAAVAA